MEEKRFMTPLGEARLRLESERKGIVQLGRLTVDGVVYASGRVSVSIVNGRWRVYHPLLRRPGGYSQYVNSCPAFTSVLRDALNAWWAQHGLVLEREQLVAQAITLAEQIDCAERSLQRDRAELQSLEERIARLPAPDSERPLGSEALASLVTPALG